MATAKALRMLVEQLLDLEPARRATVDQLCEAAYFDLVLPNAEGGARKKARRGGASAAAQALDQRPTLVVLYPQPGPGGNPLTAYKYPSLSAATTRA